MCITIFLKSAHLDNQVVYIFFHFDEHLYSQVFT